MLFPVSLLWWRDPRWQISPHPVMLTHPGGMGERIKREKVRKTFYKVLGFYIITGLVSLEFNILLKEI